MIGYSRAFNELYGPKPIERKNKMNKRILKIFNEAGFHQPEMERLGIEHKFEKFTEAIIQECARIAAATPFPDADEDIRKTFGRTWDMACVESAKNIREYFQR